MAANGRLLANIDFKLKILHLSDKYTLGRIGLARLGRPDNGHP